MQRLSSVYRQEHKALLFVVMTSVVYERQNLILDTFLHDE